MTGDGCSEESDRDESEQQLQLNTRGQRVLYSILRTGEEDEQGRPMADSTQINDYCEFPKSTLHDYFGRLEKKGVIETGQRPREKMDTDRIPPKTASITQRGMDFIHKEGGIGDALAENPDIVTDPRRLQALGDRVAGIAVRFEALRDDYEEWADEMEIRFDEAIDEAVSKQEETAIDYYEDNIEHSREAKNIANKALEAAEDAFQRTTEQEGEFEQVQQAMSEWREWSETTEERLDRLEADLDDSMHIADQLRGEVQEIRQHVMELESVVEAAFDGSRLTKSPNWNPDSWSC